MSTWGVRILWQSFSLMCTPVLIRASLSDCCYRAGFAHGTGLPPVTSQWQLMRKSSPSHTSTAHTHTHTPISFWDNTLPPILPSPPASPRHPLLPSCPPLPPTPSFLLCLFLYLTFPLMSCNTDNEPDDLPLIQLSLACLVIDP